MTAGDEHVRTEAGDELVSKKRELELALAGERRRWYIAREALVAVGGTNRD